VSNDRDLIYRYLLDFRHVPDEELRIPGVPTEVLGIVAWPLRAAIAARVPGEDRESLRRKRLHHVVPPAGVLVAAVEENQDAAGGRGWPPRAIEQPRPVPAVNQCSEVMNRVLALSVAPRTPERPDPIHRDVDARRATASAGSSPFDGVWQSPYPNIRRASDWSPDGRVKIR
jgi:hypothetical protein